MEEYLNLKRIFLFKVELSFGSLSKAVTSSFYESHLLRLCIGRKLIGSDSRFWLTILTCDSNRFLVDVNFWKTIIFVILSVDSNYVGTGRHLDYNCNLNTTGYNIVIGVKTVSSRCKKKHENGKEKVLLSSSRKIYSSPPLLRSPSTLFYLFHALCRRAKDQENTWSKFLVLLAF